MHHLMIHGISWCAHHGCPVVSLGPRDQNWRFWITFSTQDAEAMAAAPLHGSQGASLAYQLLDTVTEWLEAEVGGVLIERASNGALVALVSFDQPLLGRLDVPVSATEGIILAWRRQCPLRVDDDTLGFIRHSLAVPEPAPAARGALPSTLAPGIREFIESLDFDRPEAQEGL
jgi:bifunctional DNase/RNase